MLETLHPLVLASASAGRRALLAQIGLVPAATVAANIDERPIANESDRQTCVRLAQEKILQLRATDWARLTPTPSARWVVIAGDTIAAVGRRRLDKTDDPEQARRYLHLISGRRHRVTSAVAVAAVDADGRVHALRTRVAQTVVQWKRLSAQELETYLHSGQWQGKAGGYALQGIAQGLIKQIIGEPSTVVGLPLFLTQQLLLGMGLARYTVAASTQASPDLQR